MKQQIKPISKLGVVICTHGSVPYVHLGLEALKRNEPDVKVLVHDDFSENQLELRMIAQRYDADFVTTDYRKIPTVGDVSGFAEGLKWANEHGIDVVVKCSRRFIINKRWSEALAELMTNMQYATATGACGYFGFGFRSELVALHVASWIESGAYTQLVETVRRNQYYDSLPEAWYHHRARDVHKFIHPVDPTVSHYDNRDHEELDMLVRHERTYARPSTCDAYIQWPMMGLSRMDNLPGILWHDRATPTDYHNLAKEFGLTYELNDFSVTPGE